MFNNFSRKPCRLWDNVEMYGTAGQATCDNIIRRMRDACCVTQVPNKHSVYVTYCFSAASMVTWMLLKVTSHTHCLSRFVVNSECPLQCAAEWYVVSCLNRRSSNCHGMVMCVLLNFLWRRRILAARLPYSPDLAPSDFNPLGALKDAIPGKRLESYEEVTANSEFQPSECDREASTMRWSWPTRSCCAMQI